MRVLIKIYWSVGGNDDVVDGLPRISSRDLDALKGVLLPGDFVVVGNNGTLSHVVVHAGGGGLIHAMATEKTMRHWKGALLDALWRALGKSDRHVGVIEEPLDAFFARFERDTWVLVRHPSLTAEECGAGLARIRQLVGRPYDYGFSQSNQDYYCTEIVDEFLRAALGPRAPQLQTSPTSVPMLLDAQVLEPVVLLATPGLSVVAGNRAARLRYADRLPPESEVSSA